jgi:hypothetical protein
MSVYIDFKKNNKDTFKLTVTNDLSSALSNIVIKNKLDSVEDVTGRISDATLFGLIMDFKNNNMTLNFVLEALDPGETKEYTGFPLNNNGVDWVTTPDNLFPLDGTNYVNTAKVTFEDNTDDDNVNIVFGLKPPPTAPPVVTQAAPVTAAPVTAAPVTAAPVTAAPSTAAPSTTKKPKKKRRRPPVTEPPKQNIMDMFNNRIVQILFLTFGIILFYIKNMLGNKIISAQSNLLVVFLVIPAYIFLLHLRLKNR